MEDVNKFFGKVQVQKVCTCKVETLGSLQDAYLAKLNNGTTDQVVVVALTPHEQGSLGLKPLSQLKWTSLHVRSYASRATMEATMQNLVKRDVLLNIQPQNISMPNWGDHEDFVLRAARVGQTSTVYTSSKALPFTVTLHSSYQDNKHGSELESSIDFIPSMMTYNFSLVHV